MNRRSVAAVLVGLIVLFAFWQIYEMFGERRFDWDASFRHDSDEPFGCQLFDQMAESTLPEGYTVFTDDPDSLFRFVGRRSYLLVAHYMEWDSLTLARLDSCLRNGNKLMLVTTGFYFDTDSLRYPWENLSESMFSYHFFEKEELAKSLKGYLPADTLVFGQDGRVAVPPTLLSFQMKIPDMGFRATCPLKQPVSKLGTTIAGIRAVSVAASIGRGELHVVSCPLLFTNYGVLDPGISRFLSFQLSQIADLPVVRVEPSVLQYGTDLQQMGDGMTSPLYYMLQRPPLRWALYTLLAAIILMMFFTARRRQRMIPVISPPVNRNMEFVKILGTIYFRHHDNHDLLCKKYTYFKEELRRELLIDIDDKTEEEANLQRLSQHTGMAEGDVAGTLQMIRTLTAEGVTVSNPQLLEAMTKINEIITQI